MAKGEHNDQVTAHLTLAGFEHELRVAGFEAEEGISRLFQARVNVSAERGLLTLAQTLGRDACLELRSAEGERWLHGMVSAADFLEQDHARPRTRFKLTLCPRAWILTRNRRHRIFQHKSALQIVAAVLDEARVPHRMRSRGNRPVPERRFCVQYGESDWTFISRLLEEEGHFYYFSHGEQGHLLEIVDSPALAPVMSGTPRLEHVPPSMALPGGEYITRFNHGVRASARRVRLDDYNPERPALKLEAATPEEGCTPEISLYPGKHDSPERGKALSRIRLEEELTATVRGRGDSDCLRLAAGHWFRLADPLQTDAPGEELLVTRLTQRGYKTTGDPDGGPRDPRISYENSFECVNRGTPYRPTRVTPRPVVEGVHTAVVAGKDGEEICSDKLGRVKVHFRWDRQGGGERSSCWVRVSQVMAGSGWGALWIPRVGQEVVVSFEQGDPDRPIITGCLYHAHNPPPFSQPGGKSRSGFRSSSTPGGRGYNELSFEDRKGAEVLRLRAQRELREAVGQDRLATVGRDQKTTVDRDQKTTVKRNQEVLVQEGNRLLGVLAGDLSEQVAGRRVSTAGEGREVVVIKGGDQLTVAGGHRKVKVSDGNHSLTVKGSALTRVEDGSYTVEVGGPMFVVRCGASELRLERDGSIRLKGKTLNLLSEGCSVKVGNNKVEIDGLAIDLN